MRPIILASLLACAAIPTSAQTAPDYAVSVVVTEQFPSDKTLALVMHEPSKGRDMILLRHSAKAEDLLLALNTYRRVRSQTTDVRIGIREPQGFRSSPDRQAWAAEVLKEARRGPQKEVEGLGRVKVHEIRVK